MKGKYEVRVHVRVRVRVLARARSCLCVCVCARVPACLFCVLLSGLHFSEECSAPGQVFPLSSCESMSHTRDYDAMQVFKRDEVF